MTAIENFTYDEITLGHSASLVRTLRERDLFLFAVASGDNNPIHTDPDFAATTPFGERIAHGAWTGSLVSALLGAKFPGPGTVYRSQQLSFREPVRVGDTVTVTVTVSDKRDRLRLLTLDCRVTNQHGKTVARGTAEVIAPSEKMRLKAAVLPAITVA